MDLLLTVKLCLQLLFYCIQSLLWLLPSEGYCEAVGFSSMDAQRSGTLVFIFVSVLLDPNEVTNSADSWQFPKMLKWHYWEPLAQWDRASLEHVWGIVPENSQCDSTYAGLVSFVYQKSQRPGTQNPELGYQASRPSPTTFLGTRQEIKSWCLRHHTGKMLLHVL